MDHDWSELVDIFENLIIKYIDVLDLNDLPDPLPADSENDNSIIAASIRKVPNRIICK